MKVLFIHDRRSLGPQESSWFTFHHTSEELKRRGFLLGEYSVDYNFTNDNRKRVSDTDWKGADAIITVFGKAYGPLSIAEARQIPSFIEINYACPETVNPFMKRELDRLGLPDTEFSFEMQGLGKEMYEKATWVIGAGNKYTEDSYRDFGIKNVKMFRAGIDTELFKPDFAARSKEKKIKFTFTAAGLTFRKGLYHVLDAWNQLPDGIHKKVELHFFGAITSDIARTRISETKDRFGNLFLHGFMPNSEPEYLAVHAQADCMLCPALAEGQSATALEGMSFGLYPIVSPYTGSDFEHVPSTILSPEPEKWVEELIKTITYIASNPEKIRAAMPKIRDVAVKEYRYDDFSRKVVDFIESIHKSSRK